MTLTLDQFVEDPRLLAFLFAHITFISCCAISLYHGDDFSKKESRCPAALE
jgi:hypothetical protein